MIGQKKKRMLLTMVLIAAVFVMGVGMKVAHAGNLFDSSLNAMQAGMSQGLSEMNLAMACYAGGSSYYYDAYSYMNQAKTYAGSAYTYASYAGSGEWAYYARLYADEAYDYFVEAAQYAYLAYVNNNKTYAYIALVYGGAGGVYIAGAEAFAGAGSYGGSY